MLNCRFDMVFKSKVLISIILIIVLESFSSMSISCIDYDKTESNDLPVVQRLLELSYENCLICHMGGNKPITLHCVMYEDTSITKCVQCHKNKHTGNILPGRANVDCAECHAY